MTEIDIFNYNGDLLLSVSINESCERVEELMTEDYAQLSWNSDSGDGLPVGAYITYKGEKLSLLDPYSPTQKDESEYTYTPKFQSRVMAWGKIPYFFYTYDAENNIIFREPTWTLIDTPTNCMATICRAIENETGEVWDFAIAEGLNASEEFSFDSTDILSALNTLAQKHDTEWYAQKGERRSDGRNVIYLGDIVHESDVELSVGENVQVPSVTEGNDGFYNRFYIFGSTRNIVQSYNGANVNTFANKRLTLDNKRYPGGYIDLGDPDLPRFSKTLIFDEIYPKSHLLIYEARPRLMYRLDENQKKIQVGTDADGEPVYDRYAIWYIRITDGSKDSNGEYIPFKINKTNYDEEDNPDGSLIPGKKLSIHFNSGALEGREFELDYKDSDGEVRNSDGEDFQYHKGDYEILFVEESDYIIPDVLYLTPTAENSEAGVSGDKVVLFNIRMPDEYIAGSQIDLENAAKKRINDIYNTDTNNYELKTNPAAFEENNPHLHVNQSVVYRNGDYAYKTRILRLTEKMDYDFEQSIKIGKEKIKGNTNTLKEDVAIVNRNVDALTLVTRLTASTAQGFMRTLQTMLDRFTQKVINETIIARWNFFKGLTIGVFKRGISGAEIDDAGNIEAESAVIRKSLTTDTVTVNNEAIIGGRTTSKAGFRTTNYIKGHSGADIDGAGNSEFESIVSHSWLKVYELIYNRLNAIEGDTSFSDVGTIDAISKYNNRCLVTMRRRWDGDFTSFQPGDIVYGYINNLDNALSKEYGKAWAWVSAVDRAENNLTLTVYPDSEVPSGRNTTFSSGMVIARYGNNIEPNATTASNPDYSSFIKRNSDGTYINTRQTSFIISCEQGNIQQLINVNRPIITAKNLGIILGQIPQGLFPKNIDDMINPYHPYLYARGILVQDIIRIGYSGQILRTQNYRGLWDFDTATHVDTQYTNDLYSYDVVTWKGALWQNLTSGSTFEPSKINSGWLRMTGSDNDEIKGLWRIEPNVSQIKIDSNGAVTPDSISCIVKLNNIDGDFTYSTSSELDACGVGLWYSIDNGEYHRFIIGKRKTLSTASGKNIVTSDNRLIATQGGDVDASKVNKSVTFELRDKETLDVLSFVTINVVRDGASIRILKTQIAYAATTDSQITPEELHFISIVSNGIPAAIKRYLNTPGYHIWSRTTVEYSDGTTTISYDHAYNGINGTVGPMVYPAGQWRDNETYTATLKACPVVEYNGQYYVLQSGFTAPTDDPAHDYATNGLDAAWQLMDKMNYVFADVLMANFAKLSAAVFYGDYMFSQEGTDAEGNPSRDYQQFSLDDAGNPTDDFIPNYYVNLRTGKTFQNDAIINGHIEAKTGSFGPFGVSTDSIQSSTRESENDTYSVTHYKFGSSYSVSTTAGFSHISIGAAETDKSGNKILDATISAANNITEITVARLRAYNATYNRAIDAVGSISTNMIACGWGIQQASLTSGAKHFFDYKSDCAVIISAGGGTGYLPRLNEVQKQLNIPLATPFAVKFFIACASSCSGTCLITGYRTGIHTDVSLPHLLNNNGEETGVEMAKGDTVSIMLHYDGTNYWGYVLNHRNS